MLSLLYRLHAQYKLMNTAYAFRSVSRDERFTKLALSSKLSKAFYNAGKACVNSNRAIDALEIAISQNDIWTHTVLKDNDSPQTHMHPFMYDWCQGRDAARAAAEKPVKLTFREKIRSLTHS